MLKYAEIHSKMARFGANQKRIILNSEAVFEIVILYKYIYEKDIKTNLL